MKARDLGTSDEAKESPLRELRGVVERITFANPSTGFTVARLATERGSAPAGITRPEDRLVTIVGSLADLTPGEAITAQGWWQNNAKHGWQFSVVSYRTTLPATTQGMRKYLGSGLVKGIGPMTAGRIVEAFGEATFSVIDDAPERLRDVPGIGPVRASRIVAAWEEQRHIREVMAALQGFGISTSLAVRIYKRFREASATVITQEPFRLAREVWGIGFRTADKIAQAVGIASDAPARLQAGVLHALGESAEQGHTLLPEVTLRLEAAKLLGVPGDGLTGAMASLRESGEIAMARRDGTPGELHALAAFARAEYSLAARLQGLTAAGEKARVAAIFGRVTWEKAFAWLAQQHRVQLAPEQSAGVRMALTTPVSILTGGPGTGKTHTLRAIVLLASARRLRCLLAAPTGRAAKRMEEATGCPAMTVHRLLELRPGGNAGRNPDNPLPADLVVVDETSMLDVLLANQLVKALAPETHLLIVGDPDQLPSVGAGNVLSDLIQAEVFPVTCLQHIFRQGPGSGIAHNAQRVNAGEMPHFGGEVHDCFFLPADDPGAAAEMVVDLVVRRIPARKRFSASDVQVLTPMHRGEAGVGSLNSLLQERLNPGQPGLPEIWAGGRAYRPGDRVLQLRNDYDLGMFNGDLGTVAAIDMVEQELRLRLDDGREVRYPQANLYSLSHAYALSVHKAQGGEFPAVVLPLVTSHAPLLSRTLLYTALTRARQLLIIVGQRRALAMAVKGWRQVPRQTGLRGLLTGATRFDWRRGQADLAGDTEGDTGSWDGLLGSAYET